MSLRITFREQGITLNLTLEGRLVGPWVAELRIAWQAATPGLNGRKLWIDIRDLTFADDEGKQLLREIVSETDADISSRGIFTKHLALEITNPRVNGIKMEATDANDL